MQDAGRFLKRFETSRFRMKFDLDDTDHRVVATQGWPGIRRHAMEILTKRLAPSQPHRDGKQTPWRGHPVFKAQHATGACCRSCLKKWHGISKDRALTPLEIETITDILCAWIEMKSGKRISKHPQKIQQMNFHFIGDYAL